MNSANTDTADTSKDTEGYDVTYMERRLPGKRAVKFEEQWGEKE